jgi:hypothetical protein
VDAARLGIYGQEVYVQAASGEVYGYACLNWLLCNWRFVPEIPVDAQSSTGDPACRVDTGGAAASAPEFVETRGFSFCLPGAEVYLETARQADGGLYVWEYTRSKLIAGQVILLFGVFGGALGAGSLYLLVRNRRLPAEGPAAEDETR